MVDALVVADAASSAKLAKTKLALMEPVPLPENNKENTPKSQSHSLPIGVVSCLPKRPTLKFECHAELSLNLWESVTVASLDAGDISIKELRIHFFDLHRYL